MFDWSGWPRWSWGSPRGVRGVKGVRKVREVRVVRVVTCSGGQVVRWYSVKGTTDPKLSAFTTS